MINNAVDPFPAGSIKHHIGTFHFVYGNVAKEKLYYYFFTLVISYSEIWVINHAIALFLTVELKQMLFKEALYFL